MLDKHVKLAIKRGIVVMMLVANITFIYPTHNESTFRTINKFVHSIYGSKHCRQQEIKNARAKVIMVTFVGMVVFGFLKWWVWLVKQTNVISNSMQKSKDTIASQDEMNGLEEEKRTEIQTDKKQIVTDLNSSLEKNYSQTVSPANNNDKDDLNIQVAIIEPVEKISEQSTNISNNNHLFIPTKNIQPIKDMLYAYSLEKNVHDISSHEVAQVMNDFLAFATNEQEANNIMQSKVNDVCNKTTQEIVGQLQKKYGINFDAEKSIFYPVILKHMQKVK